MNSFRRNACCAVFGALVIFAAVNGQAQQLVDPDSPFEGIAEPTPAAGEAPPVEKSNLAGGRTPETTHYDFCRCAGETNSKTVARIEKALRSPLRSTGFDFAETPLEEVVNLLQEDYSIPIQLDTKALDEIGMDSAEAVTINLHNISLRSALRLMLKELQLTYIIHDEVLLITTPEEAESHLLVCVYDIRGLTEDASDRSSSAIVDAILSCVATETWAKNGGGEAEIRPLKPGLLVISQTQAVHEEVRALLETVSELRGLQPAASDAGASEQASGSK